MRDAFGRKPTQLVVAEVKDDASAKSIRDCVRKLAAQPLEKGKERMLADHVGQAEMGIMKQHLTRDTCGIYDLLEANLA
jgi:hypothetical protein